jgi:hypothetical protein
MTATSLGTVIANAVVPRIIVSSGWGASYHFFGAVTIVIGAICLLIVRNGTAPRASAKCGVTLLGGVSAGQ